MQLLLTQRHAAAADSVLISRVMPGPAEPDPLSQRLGRPKQAGGLVILLEVGGDDAQTA